MPDAALNDPARYRPPPGSIPEAPGVYRFSDPHGRVIYVGKAKSLRQRLNSYFADLAGLHPRTRQMVTTAAHVQWTVVGTEVEALQLEYNWIKEFDPRFNVRYRDDKTYPVLAVTMNEEFPRLHVYRGPRRKGVRYFGPYAHAWAIRETLDLLLRVFPARTCSGGVFKRHGQIGRPCLLGYIDKCSAPCVGRVDADEHRAIVEDFCDFLSGRTDHLVRQLERKMADGVGGAGVRAGRPAARRHRRAAPRDGEAGRGARRRHRRRRRRVRRRRARGRRPGLPRARRAGPRPARLGDRQGGADRHGAARRALPHPVLRRAGRAGRLRGRRPPAGPEGDPRPGAPRRGRTARRVALGAARLAGAAPGAAARRQAGARRDRRPQRRRGVHPAQAAPRRRPHRPLGGAAGDPGRARARHRAAAHRVHRRQPRAGQQRRRVAGGVRGRAGPQVGLPAVRDPGRRRGRGRRGDRRGGPAPVPALPRRDRRRRHRHGG